MFSTEQLEQLQAAKRKARKLEKKAHRAPARVPAQETTQEQNSTPRASVTTIDARVYFAAQQRAEIENAHKGRNSSNRAATRNRRSMLTEEEINAILSK